MTELPPPPPPQEFDLARSMKVLDAMIAFYRKVSLEELIAERERFAKLLEEKIAAGDV